MNIDEARKIIAADESGEPQAASVLLKASAAIIRFYSITDARLTDIAETIEDVAEGIKP